MKKILSLLIVLCTLVFPSVVNAASYNVRYYCDSKQPLDDGTFYMTCHLVINSNMEINHVKGELILKNVKLESIRPNSDWVNNGTGISVDFTASTTHNGSFSVSDFVFTGNLSDTECEASFSPTVIEETKPEKHTCAIINDEYYGKNGNAVSEVTYYEECCNYVCTVVNNEYYFNSKGKSVSYDAMLEDCSTHTIVNPSTGINYGYIILPLGIISLIGIIKFSKKSTKIYKI